MSNRTKVNHFPAIHKSECYIMCACVCPHMCVYDLQKCVCVCITHICACINTYVCAKTNILGTQYTIHVCAWNPLSRIPFGSLLKGYVYVYGYKSLIMH